MKRALVASALLALFTGIALASPYQLMLQTRQNVDGPNEVFLGSYASLDDVFAGNVGAPTGYTEIGVSANFRIVGLTYDGSYRVMVETRLDGTAPYEVFVASFASLDDLFAGTTAAPTNFTEIAIAPSFQIVGFTGEWLPAAAVSEPGTGLLFALGLAGAGWISARARR